MILVKTDKSKYKKGVALIFALFTIVVLCAISTTVTALAVNNSHDTKRFNANEYVLHAANWGIEAAINYMGVWNGSSLTCALSQNGLHVKKKSLTSTDLTKFGVDTSKLSGSIGTVSLLTFHDGSVDGNPHRLNDNLNHNFLVGVVVVELKYDNNQPSIYHLRSIAKMTDEGNNDYSDLLRVGRLSNCTTRVVEADVREQTASDFMHFIENARSWDANGVDLSGRGWIQYADGSSNTRKTQNMELARSAVLLPENYSENGKLYVSGHSSDTTDLAKQVLRGQYDGRLGFFAGDGSTGPQSSKYTFTDDVTTRYGVDKYAYRTRGNHADVGIGKSTVLGMMQGNWNTGDSSLGLDSGYKMPQERVKWYDKNGNLREGTFFDKTNYLISTDTSTGKKAVQIRIGSNLRNETVYNINSIAGNYSTDKCPDVAQAVSGTTVSNSPTFATVRVEVKGNTCRILKYNSAVSKSTGEYVENITPGGGTININKIKQGVISVEGGNVEIVEVSSFPGGNAFGTVVDGGNSMANALKSELTVVTDVDKCRDMSLNRGYDYNDPEITKGWGYNSSAGGWNNNTDSSVYSSVARKYLDWLDEALNGGYTLTSDTRRELESLANSSAYRAPYSSQSLKDTIAKAKEIVEQSKTDVTNSKNGEYTAGTLPDNLPEVNINYSNSDVSNKVLWPTPANRAIEREGNIVIGSDLRQSGDGSSLGLIAKNFIYLNDRNYDVNGKRELCVDGVLMSYDHSVQFDWNNLTNNGNLNNHRGLDDSGFSGEKIEEKDSSGKKNIVYKNIRKFTLNGSIVGGFLDCEGDTYGRGYFYQNFKHDDRLLYHLPPHFPTFSTDSTVSIQYILLSYKDNGALQ
ncbi:hypothetical protein IJT10_04490 [bacterium]|nr:hypothetical protein [bacterium]